MLWKFLGLTLECQPLQSAVEQPTEQKLGERI